MTSIHEDADLALPVSCGVGLRCGSDLGVCGCGCGIGLWLSPDLTLAWEPPYAAGAALKRPNKKKRKKDLLNSPNQLFLLA